MSLCEGHFLNAECNGTTDRESYNESEDQETVSKQVLSTQIQTTNNISKEQNHEQCMTSKVFHLQKGKRISKEHTGLTFDSDSAPIMLNDSASGSITNDHNDLSRN